MAGQPRWGFRGERKSERMCHTWNQLVLPNPSTEQEEARRREEETRMTRGEPERKKNTRRTRAVSLPDGHLHRIFSPGFSNYN